MAHCILRFKKLKTFGAVASSAKHTYRETPTSNIEAERKPMNQHIGAKSAEGVLSTLRELLLEKRRKDAVIAMEYLTTASREFFNGQTRAAYFKAGLDFLRRMHGKKT